MAYTLQQTRHRQLQKTANTPVYFHTVRSLHWKTASMPCAAQTTNSNLSLYKPFLGKAGNCVVSIKRSIATCAFLHLHYGLSKTAEEMQQCVSLQSSHLAVAVVYP